MVISVLEVFIKSSTWEQFACAASNEHFEYTDSRYFTFKLFQIKAMQQMAA